MLQELERDQRKPAPDEQSVLARWSGWGALPAVFDEAEPGWADVRRELRGLLDEAGWSAARRTTINAHYTSADVARAVWDAVVSLGFSGGRVLEPGCGSGNFIGMAPAELVSDMVGVELDPTTAAVAAALYPGAEIRAEGFERTRFPPGWFDLTVGNVPFGKVVLHDPVFNPRRHSIHNHFIVKSLRLTRPGGLVVTVTSRYTLDSRSPGARREMAELADFLGAVRLPAGAFRASAGTDAVTDIVLLRRREEDRPPAAVRWEHLAASATDDGEVELNEWFAAHPELVLGELRATGGQYREDELTVAPGPGRLDDALRLALSGLAERAVDGGLGWASSPKRAEIVPPEPTAGIGPPRKEGSVFAAPGGGFARVVDGVAQVHEPRPRSDRAELAAVIAVRDALLQVLDAQARTNDDDAFAAAQTALNRVYDTYTKRWGPLNRFSLAATGRSDPTSGAPVLRRLRPRMGGFRDDPDFPSVLALEVFDPDAQTARKAAVFSERIVAPRQARRGADSAQDALALCLDEHGQVDLAVIAGLLGVSPEKARAELGSLVWADPETGEFVPAAAYLSGNVRHKLAAAEGVAARDARYQAHVDALRAVVPVDLGPDEIDVRLGAPWIPASDVVCFAREVLGCAGALVDHAPVTATWAVKAASYERQSVATTSTWGTPRADAVGLLQASLNQQAATVYDHLDNGSRVLNAPETLAAREKQEALETRFSEWVWEDPERSRRLAATYNELFNASVVPRYDGAHLSLPGLSCAFRPHPHQRDAVWRILQEPTVLLAHSVGAGKTATMVMGGMELRRLGMARKPAYVVPNHMLEQFANEFLQLYPQARVLVAGRADASPVGRKHFVARCATGDWDAVVITRSAFERIPVSPATRRSFLERRMVELREAVSASAGLTVKRLEVRLASLGERHKRLLADERKDDGVNFEATGIDYLFIDEAQAFKNRQFATRIQGVGGEGSMRAEDLELKVEYLRSRHGARVATFATATPIANSLAEMYVMQAYLQPEVLARAGLSQFDAWAATFGRTITALELAPDGASYRLTSRFARFRNVPELLTMFRAVADVRGSDELGLAIPGLAGGRPETVVVPPSETLRAYVAGLAARAERVRSRAVRAEEDNMLKISGDGRKAALDLRLVGEPADDEAAKIAAAAERIARLFHDTRQAIYRETTGEPSGRTGAFQMVFCDLGTPRTDGGWSVYGELRRQLARRDVPEDEVRFIHEATDDRAKAELFAACRAGRVAVLVGSTEKMGVGTNAQTRLVALHHLDCPWRPADIEQREGRALRQGNQNAEVAIIRYVTEGSFDVFMWQTVQRKAEFIHQVMAGTLGSREVEDIGQQALSYAEVKALATGSPLLMEKAGVDNEVARLSRLRRAHHQDQTRLARVLEAAAARAARMERLVAQHEEAILRRLDTRGDRFEMSVEAVRFTSRADAGTALKGVVVQALAPAPPSGDHQCGSLGGFPVEVYWERDGRGAVAQLRLVGTPTKLSMTEQELHDADPVGLVQRLEHRLRGLEGGRDDATAELARSRSEAGMARGRLGQAFEHEPRLADLLRRQAEIESALTAETTADVNLPVHLLPAALAARNGPELGIDR